MTGETREGWIGWAVASRMTSTISSLAPDMQQQAKHTWSRTATLMDGTKIGNRNWERYGEEPVVATAIFCTCYSIRGTSQVYGSL